MSTSSSFSNSSHDKDLCNSYKQKQNAGAAIIHDSTAASASTARCKSSIRCTNSSSGSCCLTKEWQQQSICTSSRKRRRIILRHRQGRRTRSHQQKQHNDTAATTTTTTLCLSLWKMKSHQEQEEERLRRQKRHNASINVISLRLLSLLLFFFQQLQVVDGSSYPNNNPNNYGRRPPAGGRGGQPPQQPLVPPMYPKRDRPFPPIPSQQRQDPLFEREDNGETPFDGPSSELYPPGRPPQTRYSSYLDEQQQQQRGPPPRYPPPPGINNGNLPRPSSSSQAPPSQYTQRTPIDFNFPSVDMRRQEPQSSSSSSTSSSNSSIGRIEIDPITGDAIVRDDADGDDEDDKLLEDQYKKKRRSSTDDEYDTPRHDLVSRYIHRSKYRHKAMVAFSASSMGYTIGYFITKSLLGNKLSKPFASILALTFMVWSILSRGPYGEMARAIGVAVLLLIENSASIRKEYPVGGHLKAMVKASPRQPFPPHTSNPWQYIQEYDDDIAFSMIKSLMAMTLLGCLCGGSLQIPLVPTWMGALVCASVFAYMTTLKDDPKGDLARTVGMKCVALCGEFWQINQELETLSKIQTVIGKIFDKLMILDRKHRIKDKLIAGGSWIYGKISTMIQQVKNDVGDSDFKDVMEQVENVVGTSEGDDDDNKKR